MVRVFMDIMDIMDIMDGPRGRVILPAASPSAARTPRPVKEAGGISPR